MPATHVGDRIQYRFRIFDASTGIDFEEADERFVNAMYGDTMTGRLKLEAREDQKEGLETKAVGIKTQC